MDDDRVDQNVQYSDAYQSSDADSSVEMMMPSAEKVDCMNHSDDCQVDLIEVNEVNDVCAMYQMRQCEIANS